MNWQDLEYHDQRQLRRQIPSWQRPGKGHKRPVAPPSDTAWWVGSVVALLSLLTACINSVI